MAKILFNILLLFFAFLIVQDNLPFITSDGVRGAYIPKENIQFDWKKWWTGEYQQQKDIYLNENFAFRSDLLRLHNQMDYSFFRKSNAASVIVGKEEYLYEEGYILSYLGINFAGQGSIDYTANQIKQLQDTLAAKGKLLVTMIAPSKGYFYPEYIPSHYPSQPKEATNYSSFLASVKKFEEQGQPLNLIDFNKWILGMKDTSKYCLYPKTGTHWSLYSAALAVDSLANYVEEKTQVDIPDIEWTDIEISKQCRLADCDIEQALNLIWPIESGPFAYPKLNFIQKDKKRLKTIIIGDSFFFNMYHYNIMWSLFQGGSEFWYYYNSILPGRKNQEGLSPRDLDLAKELDDAELVIIMHREETINSIGAGFIQSANNIYTQKSE